jgi:hypothetical protein
MAGWLAINAFSAFANRAVAFSGLAAALHQAYFEVGIAAQPIGSEKSGWSAANNNYVKSSIGIFIHELPVFL